jgi:hypothetical protein
MDGDVEVAVVPGCAVGTAGLRFGIPLILRRIVNAVQPEALVRNVSQYDLLTVDLPMPRETHLS